MIIKLYLIAFPIFLGIDLVWLGVISNSFYQQQLGSLISEDVNWIPAIIFYLLFIVGLVFFVIKPGLEKKSLKNTILNSSIFGLVTYATYDLTNLATIRDWPLLVTVVDLLWGVFISISVSLLTYLIAKKILK